MVKRYVDTEEAKWLPALLNVKTDVTTITIIAMMVMTIVMTVIAITMTVTPS